MTKQQMEVLLDNFSNSVSWSNTVRDKNNKFAGINYGVFITAKQLASLPETTYTSAEWMGGDTYLVV